MRNLFEYSLPVLSSEYFVYRDLECKMIDVTCLLPYWGEWHVLCVSILMLGLIGMSCMCSILVLVMSGMSCVLQC